MTRIPNSPAAAESCPICGRPSEHRVAPFCSPRCADIDLGRWLTDGYAIPVRDDDEDAADRADLPGQGETRSL